MNYHNAFTMIELIFVIVIIGILSAIALPKLATTRDDAHNAADCQNISTCITDLVAEYTATLQIHKSNHRSCTEAESSEYNNISLSINGKTLDVSGAPAACSRLNGTYQFGGVRISL